MESSRSRQEVLTDALVGAHGEMVSGRVLWQSLGFRTERSFHRALAVGRVPIEIFRIKGRRGRFARTRDVAGWIAGLGSVEPETHPMDITIEKKGGNRPEI